MKLFYWSVFPFSGVISLCRYAGNNQEAGVGYPVYQGEPHKREKGYAWQTMLVQASSLRDAQTANTSSHASPKCNICTLNCTLEETAVFNFLREQPKATQKEIATHIG